MDDEFGFALDESLVVARNKSKRWYKNQLFHAGLCSHKSNWKSPRKYMQGLFNNSVFIKLRKKTIPSEIDFRAGHEVMWMKRPFNCYWMKMLVKLLLAKRLQEMLTEIYWEKRHGREIQINGPFAFFTVESLSSCFEMTGG